MPELRCSLIYVAEHNLSLRLTNTLLTLMKTIASDNEIAKRIQHGCTSCNCHLKSGCSTLNEIKKKLFFITVIPSSSDSLL